MIADDSLTQWARKREEQFAEIAAKEASLRERVLQQLYGGLWHTTHPERFKGILSTGAILPEPNISDSERWYTGAGQKHHPYARILGGVSLFDFDHFDPHSYREQYPLSSWAYFVPCHSAWGSAVWIEINRAEVAPPEFLAALELVAKWKADGAYGHNIMPEIEAAYIGASSTGSVQTSFSGLQRHLQGQ